MAYLFAFLMLWLTISFIPLKTYFTPSAPLANQASIETRPMMNNNLDIYQVLTDVLPELKKQKIPLQYKEFVSFRDWMNEQHQYMQYVEIKEYFDNGITESEILKNAQVDTERLEAKIEQDVEQIRGQYTEEQFEALSSEQQFDLNIAIDETVEKALFENIKRAAEEKNLKLFVVERENPYWFVLPNHPDKNQKIVDAFNQAFAEGGVLRLVLY